ncbi:MAG: response regulator [bacterium]|nr:response regulator [bacterium]
MEKAKKILIMEDEKPMARALELKLTHAGFDAIAVFDGEAGMALLEKEEFGLIILDLVMPKMDGFSVLQALKDKKIDIPVIVSSNLSQPDDETRARDLGAKDFFIKSNTPIASIVEHVQKFFT